MGLLDGIRVVEVASWGFVPTAGVTLADWGAEVIKIEHPTAPDPMRGLTTSGARATAGGGVHFMFELNNRGKRSVALNLRDPRGREALYRLVDSADVFLTSFLPDARRRMSIDVPDILARKPGIVYGRGSGAGPAGPEAERGGFDAASFWARSGLAYKIAQGAGDQYMGMPVPAIGDTLSGVTLAGGIAAALYRRAVRQQGAVVDVSLLNTAMSALRFEITGALVLGREYFYRGTRDAATNPLTTGFTTADGRAVQLVLLQAQRFWPDLCLRLGAPELADDPRFATDEAREENRAELFETLDRVFGSRTLEQWRRDLADAEGVWAAAQTPREVSVDPQVTANGYITTGVSAAGKEYPLVAGPVMVSGETPEQRPAPEHGGDTELVLIDAGYTWDELGQLKADGVIP